MIVPGPVPLPGAVVPLVGLAKVSSADVCCYLLSSPLLL